MDSINPNSNLTTIKPIIFSLIVGTVLFVYSGLGAYSPVTAMLDSWVVVFLIISFGLILSHNFSRISQLILLSLGLPLTILYYLHQVGIIAKGTYGGSAIALDWVLSIAGNIYAIFFMLCMFDYVLTLRRSKQKHILRFIFAIIFALTIGLYFQIGFSYLIIFTIPIFIVPIIILIAIYSYRLKKI